MRLPLLLGARPRVLDRGPDVPLGNGEWIITHTCKDTVLTLLEVGGTLLIPLDGAPVVIIGPRTVHVKMHKPGSEDLISVFAERSAA